jgi:hypothetical protein
VNNSSSPRVEGRSDLGVAEVSGVWWCWNRRRVAAEGDDGGDEDGERSASSADGEWLASSAPSVSGAQRRRPAPLSWFRQQICHRGRCMAVLTWRDFRDLLDHTIEIRSKFRHVVPSRARFTAHALFLLKLHFYP